MFFRNVSQWPRNTGLPRIQKSMIAQWITQGLSNRIAGKEFMTKWRKLKIKVSGLNCTVARFSVLKVKTTIADVCFSSGSKVSSKLVQSIVRHLGHTF